MLPLLVLTGCLSSLISERTVHGIKYTKNNKDTEDRGHLHCDFVSTENISGQSMDIYKELSPLRSHSPL